MLLRFFFIIMANICCYQALTQLHPQVTAFLGMMFICFVLAAVCKVTD